MEKDYEIIYHHFYLLLRKESCNTNSSCVFRDNKRNKISFYELLGINCLMLLCITLLDFLLHNHALIIKIKLIFRIIRD